MIFLRRDRKPDKFDSVSPLFVFCIFFLFLFFLPSFFAQGVGYLASQQRHLYNTGCTTGKLIDRKESKKDAFFLLIFISLIYSNCYIVVKSAINTLNTRTD